MRTLSLSTRLFLSCFFVSALLFCGIYFYVKGFNGQREIARAEQAFERSVSRYKDYLQAHDQSLEDAANTVADDPDYATRKQARADLLATGLSFAVLRASGAESENLVLSPSDIESLRATRPEATSLVDIGANRFYAKAVGAGKNDSWKLVLLYPIAEFERASQELLEAFLVAGGALLLLTTIFSQLLAREITRPLTTLRDKVRAMAIEVGFEPPALAGDEIQQMTMSYLDVAKNLHTAFEHKKLALDELEAYKGELLRVNQNLHRRLFQVKVLLSLWSERDKALDVKDFLSRFLEALLPGLPFEYGCVIIRPIAEMGSETIFAKKIDIDPNKTPVPKELQEETPGPGTQWTNIIDPQVKEFLLRESDTCMQSLTLKLGYVEGCIRQGSTPTKITVLSLRLKQGEEPLGSLHFLTEQQHPKIAESMTDFLLNLSSQVAAQLQIQALSSSTRIDPLTRLYNRGYLNDKLREELVRSSRTAQAFSLVLLDLDHFKKVNEIHGQQAADEVLRGVATLLKKSCRGSDAICRYNGAEIAILLTDTPLEGAKIFAENVRKAIDAESFAIPGGGSLHVTVSMGLAAHPNHGDGVEELLTKVEHALLEAKDAGRNAWKAVA